MNLRPDILLTLGGDAIALVMMLFLLIVISKAELKDRVEVRLFRNMIFATILEALLDAACYALRYQVFTGASVLALLARTAQDLNELNLCFFWLLFVDNVLYHSKDHLFRRYRYALIPIAYIFITLIVNLFTGFLFTFDENLKCQTTGFHDFNMCIVWAYIIASVVVMLQYKKTRGSLHVIRVEPFLIPLIVASFFTAVSNASFLAFGLAVGFISIYSSMLKKSTYVDLTTGLYNESYLDYLKERSAAGLYPFGSALIFQLTGNDEEAVRIIKRELPSNSEIMRLSDGAFLMVIHRREKTILRLMEESVKDSVMDYNERNPETKLQLKSLSRVRKDGEKLEDFIGNVRAELKFKSER